MKRITLTVVILSLMALGAGPASAQTGHDLFQQALLKERAEGELREAIQLYEQIVRDFAADRTLAARALVQVGQCYEKLGSTEAERAYQRVVSDFADQADLVAQARERLAALRPAAATSRGQVAQMLLRRGPEIDISNPRAMTPSPDGRRVAYAQGGAVYVRDLASGEVQQVAPGRPAVSNWGAIWSPDGKRLAFRQVNLETEAGSIQFLDLASGETVAVPQPEAGDLYLLDWSRDGRYLLANHDRGSLELVAVSDGTMTTLSDSIWVGQRASFSPDGRFVTYAAGKYGSESVYVRPLTGGPRRWIADSRGGVYLHPLWSPDGRAIAFQYPDGIWVVPVTDGVASGEPRLAYRSDIPKWAVAWTEAGGLYFTLNAQTHFAYQVAVNPATGAPSGAAEELPRHTGGMISFLWSPDMQRIAFFGWRRNDIDIYAVDANAMTSHDRFEPDGFIMQGWWSQGGQEIVYELFQQGAGSALKALDPATGRVRELSPPRLISGLYSLSSDHRLMTFLRDGADSVSVELVVAEVGQADGTVVATAGGSNGALFGRSFGFSMTQISPRGDQVLFVRQGGDEPNVPNAAWSLWIVNSDGTGTRQITTASEFSSAMWDPSGRFIAYTTPADGTEGSVLRVVDVATGAERGVAQPIPNNRAWITDWSRDGRFIGVLASKGRWEYWAVQGLMEGAR